MSAKDTEVSTEYDLANMQECTFCYKHNRRIPCHRFVRYGTCVCGVWGLVRPTCEFCPICIGESKPEI